MGILIVDVETEIEKNFRRVVEKRFGPGDHVVEEVVTTLMKKWVEAQADAKS